MSVLPTCTLGNMYALCLERPEEGIAPDTEKPELQMAMNGHVGAGN